MIKVYYLPVDRIDNCDTPKGSRYIHHAVMECTEDPNVRKLVMDTTPDEDAGLLVVAVSNRKPTKVENDNLEWEKANMLTVRPRDLVAEIDELKAKVRELEGTGIIRKS